jgi:DNA polymerase-3 subunit delta
VDYRGLLRAIESGPLPAVLLVHGGEPLLLEDAVTRVTTALFPDGAAASLSREVLDAREAGPDAIVRAALTLPFLAERRLVVARGVEALGSRPPQSLVDYVTAPNPSTVLLLAAGEELAAAHWLVEAVPAAAVVRIPRPTGRSVVAALRDQAGARGYEITAEALTLLVALVGEDLTTLVGEMEKAALSAGPGNRRVTADDVRAIVGEHRLRHIFDLTRALERRDRGAALVLLGALLDAGEEPLGVLGMLAREARTVWQAQAELGRGRAPEDVARTLRRPPPAASALVALAGSLSPEAAVRRLRRCWEVERGLKSGSPPRPELTLLVSDLCAM